MSIKKEALLTEECYEIIDNKTVLVKSDSESIKQSSLCKLSYIALFVLLLFLLFLFCFLLIFILIDTQEDY